MLYCLLKRSYRSQYFLFRMASSNSNTYNVCIPADVIPTAETKVKLADQISISPLGNLNPKMY